MKGVKGMDGDDRWLRPVRWTDSLSHSRQCRKSPRPVTCCSGSSVTDQAGKPVTNAQVFFVYTMPMPGMADSKATARHTKDGIYEGTVRFGMGGTWLVTVNMTVPGRPPIAEKFQFSVAGGGM